MVYNSQNSQQFLTDFNHEAQSCTIRSKYAHIWCNKPSGEENFYMLDRTPHPDGHSSRKRQVLLSPPYMHKLSLGGEVFRRLTSPKQGSLIFYRSVHSYTILHRTTNFSMNNHLGKRGSHSIPKGTVLPWKIYWQMAVKWFTIPMNNHFNNHF